jgi:hypothetical protein
MLSSTQRRRENAGDQLAFRDKNRVVKYMTSQCIVLKRNAEDIER